MIARRAGRSLAALALVLVMAAPLYLMVTNALKSQHDIQTEPYGWPTGGLSLK